MSYLNTNTLLHIFIYIVKYEFTDKGMLYFDFILRLQDYVCY